MSDIVVFRPAPDGKSRQVWSFSVNKDWGAVSICLNSYCIQRRVGKGRFSNATPPDRWQSCDERRYSSGLPRPTEIPADVMDEAKAQVAFRFYIGWTNQESVYPKEPTP